jgi:hypothetical protein
MAEVHARKASEANKASQAVEKAQKASNDAQKAAKALEEKAISDALKKHSSAVVAKWVI